MSKSSKAERKDRVMAMGCLKFSKDFELVIWVHGPVYIKFAITKF